MCVLVFMFVLISGQNHTKQNHKQCVELSCFNTLITFISLLEHFRDAVCVQQSKLSTFKDNQLCMYIQLQYTLYSNHCILQAHIWSLKIVWFYNTHSFVFNKRLVFFMFTLISWLLNVKSNSWKSVYFIYSLSTWFLLRNRRISC